MLRKSGDALNQVTDRWGRHETEGTRAAKEKEDFGFTNGNGTDDYVITRSPFLDSDPLPSEDGGMRLPPTRPRTAQVLTYVSTYLM